MTVRTKIGQFLAEPTADERILAIDNLLAKV